MTRVKRGVIANKRRKNVLKYTKGFRWSRKSKFRAAKEALLHAWSHKFVGRKLKKRQNRALWNIQINAAARERHLTYGKLIYGLRKAKIEINRKILSQLARQYPAVFNEILSKIEIKNPSS